MQISTVICTCLSGVPPAKTWSRVEACLLFSTALLDKVKDKVGSSGALLVGIDEPSPKLNCSFAEKYYMAPNLLLLGQHSSDDLSHPDYSVVQYSEGQSPIRTLHWPAGSCNQCQSSYMRWLACEIVHTICAVKESCAAGLGRLAPPPSRYLQYFSN